MPLVHLRRRYKTPVRPAFKFEECRWWRRWGEKYSLSGVNSDGKGAHPRENNRTEGRKRKRTTRRYEENHRERPVSDNSAANAGGRDRERKKKGGQLRIDDYLELERIMQLNKLDREVLAEAVPLFRPPKAGEKTRGLIERKTLYSATATLPGPTTSATQIRI
ncbi:hypothetical protein ALC62_09734 [Cyphomyrmex costatus]|uniref:Uncharacterized protein n=1 Tax=Cyphomyrmex costatus TaxID=456900 RepID=A0A151IF73_9HYME|nr:hypothetical protein ALC62_09734 [Cyphomyrmex costatus]